MKTESFLARQMYMKWLLAGLFGIFALITRIVFDSGGVLKTGSLQGNFLALLFHFIYSFSFSLSGFYLWMEASRIPKANPIYPWKYPVIALFFLASNEFFFLINAILLGKPYHHGLFEEVFYALHFFTYITIWVFGNFFLAFQKSFETSLENEILKRERLKNQLEALRNQLNPHFLFNALNILNISIISDPDLAQKIVYDLSDILRYNLKAQNQSLSLLEDEINAAQSYLDLYKARFGDKLVFYFMDIKPSKEWYVIPLSLQILIENAIKHNIITTNKVLLIEIRLDEPQQQLLVINSVNRKQNVPSTGVGLQNLDKRYRLQTGERPTLQTDEEQFIVKVPLIEGA